MSSPTSRSLAAAAAEATAVAEARLTRREMQQTMAATRRTMAGMMSRESAKVRGGAGNGQVTASQSMFRGVCAPKRTSPLPSPAPLALAADAEGASPKRTSDRAQDELDAAFDAWAREKDQVCVLPARRPAPARPQLSRTPSICQARREKKAAEAAELKAMTERVAAFEQQRRAARPAATGKNNTRAAGSNKPSARSPKARKKKSPLHQAGEDQMLAKFATSPYTIYPAVPYR